MSEFKKIFSLVLIDILMVKPKETANWRTALDLLKRFAFKGNASHQKTEQEHLFLLWMTLISHAFPHLPNTNWSLTPPSSLCSASVPSIIGQRTHWPHLLFPAVTLRGLWNRADIPDLCGLLSSWAAHEYRAPPDLSCTDSSEKLPKPTGDGASPSRAWAETHQCTLLPSRSSKRKPLGLPSHFALIWLFSMRSELPLSHKVSL